MSKATDAFDHLVGMSILLDRGRVPNKPGALLERLPAKEREALKDLKSSEIQVRPDYIFGG